MFANLPHSIVPRDFALELARCQATPLEIQGALQDVLGMSEAKAAIVVDEAKDAIVAARQAARAMARLAIWLTASSDPSMAKQTGNGLHALGMIAKGHLGYDQTVDAHVRSAIDKGERGRKLKAVGG